VRTVRAECPDWLLILNARHLEQTLKDFVDHYNACRPHRSLGLVPPNGPPTVTAEMDRQPLKVKRRDRLGGLVHEYLRAA
jgi:putative transposase